MTVSNEVVAFCFGVGVGVNLTIALYVFDGWLARRREAAS